MSLEAMEPCKPDEFDTEIERITRENPEKIARIIAKADADLEAGRCQPMNDLLESEDRE